METNKWGELATARERYEKQMKKEKNKVPFSEWLSEEIQFV